MIIVNKKIYFVVNGDVSGINIINADESYPSNVCDSNWNKDIHDDYIGCVYYKKITKPTF